MRRPKSAFAEEHNEKNLKDRQDSPTVVEADLRDIDQKKLERSLLLKLDIRYAMLSQMVASVIHVFEQGSAIAGASLSDVLSGQNKQFALICQLLGALIHSSSRQCKYTGVET